jgi:hypothetical protein
MDLLDSIITFEQRSLLDPNVSGILGSKLLHTAAAAW